MTDITDISKFVHSGLIESEELDALIRGNHPVILLDASAVLPGAAVNPRTQYEGEHIANALFFDIEAISDHTSPLPHMLPRPEDFEKDVSALGISNNSLIVVYGQAGLVMGPARAWWMFRYFGHQQILVLNGGLPAWKEAGLPTTSAPVNTPEHAETFKAIPQPHLLTNKQQIDAAIALQSAHILDARPSARFQGQEPEPRVGLKSGHMEGALNIPAGQLVYAQSGKLKSKEDLALILENQGFGNNSPTPVITTCGSGITACVIALALFNLGNKNASVYDGSWAEWGIKQ